MKRPKRRPIAALIWRCIDEECSRAETTRPDVRSKTCACGQPMHCAEEIEPEDLEGNEDE